MHPTRGDTPTIFASREGIDQKAPKVGWGREREWLVALSPGGYRISCPISSHANRGMTGTLTVVP